MQGHVPILSVGVLYFKSTKRVQTKPEWAAASSETKRWNSHGGGDLKGIQLRWERLQTTTVPKIAPAVSIYLPKAIKSVSQSGVITCTRCALMVSMAHEAPKIFNVTLAKTARVKMAHCCVNWVAWRTAKQISSGLHYSVSALQNKSRWQLLATPQNCCASSTQHVTTL